jgi:hypothetical protein
VEVSQADSGAGSTYYPLDFTNTSAAACELYGYPGVSFVTTPAGTGRQIGVAALRGTAFAKVTVTLAPGQTEAGYVSHRFSACSSGRAALLTVLPVRPGRGRQGITP